MIKEMQFSGIGFIGNCDIKDLGKCNLIIPASHDEWMNIEIQIEAILDGLFLYKKKEDSLIDSMHTSFGDNCFPDEKDTNNDIVTSSKIVFSNGSFIEVRSGEYIVQKINTSDEIVQKKYSACKVCLCPSNGIYIVNMINEPARTPEEEYKYINDLLNKIDDYEQIFIISYSYIVLCTLYLYALKHPKEIKIVSQYDDHFVTQRLEDGMAHNSISVVVRKLCMEIGKISSNE